MVLLFKDIFFFHTHKHRELVVVKGGDGRMSKTGEGDQEVQNSS